MFRILPFLAFFFAATSALADTAPINAFHDVTPGIFRGARPSPAGLAYLSRQGVRTDLDLENDARAIAAEKVQAEKLGMNFVSYELNAEETPSDAEINQILAIVEDPANYPLFIHCKLGEDRTGLVVALFRVESQKWAAADAYSEWLADGFHTRLTNLSDYFDARTGYTPR
jgi:tyrosine-protein phosphatase SIW14